MYPGSVGQAFLSLGSVVCMELMFSGHSFGLCRCYLTFPVVSAGESVDLGIKLASVSTSVEATALK